MENLWQALLSDVELWIRSQNPLNFLFAFLAGGGVFALVMGLLQRQYANLLDIDRTLRGGRAEPSWQERVQRLLDDARVNIKVREFVLFLLAWSLGVGVVFLLATRLPVGGLFGLAFGAAGYWLWLQRRAAAHRAQYEGELGQVVARLVSGASAGNTFLSAAEYASRFGPEVCRADWVYISEQVRLNVPPEQVFKALSEQRRSGLLNLVLELLLLAVKEGAPLSQTLPPIQKALEERQRIVNRARTEFNGKMRDMLIVASVPFLLIVAYSWVSPQMASVYSTPIGQLAIAAGWLVTLLSVWYVYRYFETELFALTDYVAKLGTEAARPSLAPERGPEPGLVPQLDGGKTSAD